MSSAAARLAHRPQDLRQNHLLAALPENELARLTPHLERTSLKVGQPLFSPGAEIRHVYFPVTAIVSLLYVLENGASAEIAVIGNDGLAGVSLVIGGAVTTCWAIVQSAGYAYRMEGRWLKEAFNRAEDDGTAVRLQGLLLRYTQALLTQMAQTAVCNRHHSVDQQLCRWLLLRLDRSPANELTMTQEQIANLLGVRREGVTEAAGRLHKAGIIDYRRGHITVLDRAEMEARACECYAVVKAESDRLARGGLQAPKVSTAMEDAKLFG
jgi:CRP-like cAMP-binding protein